MTETHSSSAGPVCPHCKHENASDGGWAEQIGEGTTECEECGKPFKFWVDYTTHYYAAPVGDKDK